MSLLTKITSLTIRKTISSLLSVLALSLVIFAGSVSPVLAFEIIQNTIWAFVNSVFGLLLGLAGLILNTGINNFVIGFGDSFINSNVGVAVDTLWESVRDIFNLTFIFGLVYIGFKMILNSDDSSTRQWLVHLILAALLVNFSLFITKFVVDMSNITATQIITNGFTPNATTGKINVSDTFMDSLGVQSTWGAELPEGLQKGENSPWGYIFGTAVLFLVASFVFAAGGVMLIIRYAALCLYMILSPLMFIGWVFPQMQSYTTKYWSGFLGRAFFAPMYFLLIYFAAVVIAAFYGDNGVGSPNFADLFTGKGSTVISNFENTIPPFILACIFLIAALVVAQKMGADGASASLKIGRNLRSKVQRGVGSATGSATVGSAAWAGRRSIGYGAQKLTENEKFKNIASRHTILGKGAFKAAQGVAGASFDARQVAGVGAGLGIGTGSKGGYTKIMTDKNKADEKFVKDTEAAIDPNDPEVQAKVAARAAEIEKAAEKEKEALTVLQTTLAEDKDKDSSTITTDITKLKATIEKLENEAKEHATAPTMTKQQLEAHNDKLATEKRRLTLKQENFTRTKQKETLDSDISALGSQPQTVEVLKQIEDKKETQEQLKADRQKQDAVYTTAIAKQTNDSRDAAAIAISEIQNANLIAYMQALESSEKFWNKAATMGLGGVAGDAVGVQAGLTAGGNLLAAGTGVAGFGAGAAATRSQAHLNQASRSNLERKFGRTPLEMAKNKQKQKDALIIAEQLKKAGATDDNNEATPAPTAEPTPNNNPL